MKTDTLLLHRSLGAALPQDYIDWAVDQLASGVDTPNIRILAGLSAKLDTEEIESYFRKVCLELGIDAPLKTAHFNGTVRLIRRAYDCREISASDAIDRMYDLYIESDFGDSLLSIWDNIIEELALKGSGDGGYFYPPDLLDSPGRLFITEFSLLERALNLKLPKDFMHYIQCSRCNHIGESVLKHRSWWDKLAAKLSFNKTPALWHTCARCGSFEYACMWDPAVRDFYFSKLEKEQGL